MKQKLCCADATPGNPPYSPFGKVLSLGWYDGTTSGLAQCASCSATFKYDLVDWDADQEQRIFALSRIPREAFDSILGILKAFESPKWPFWNPRWKIQPPELSEITKSKVDTYLSTASGPGFLVISDRELRTVFALSQVTDALREKLPKEFDGLPVTNDFNSWLTHLVS